MYKVRENVQVICNQIGDKSKGHISPWVGSHCRVHLFLEKIISFKQLKDSTLLLQSSKSAILILEQMLHFNHLSIEKLFGVQCDLNR